ncbi:hypothetical protein OAC87_02145 [Pseudomonadales bacterium]|nr:hypothetical protein [Pseudomonadales bacterium]
MGISSWQAGVTRVSGRWGWSWVGVGLVLGWSWADLGLVLGWARHIEGMVRALSGLGLIVRLKDASDRLSHYVLITIYTFCI